MSEQKKIEEILDNMPVVSVINPNDHPFLDLQKKHPLKHYKEYNRETFKNLPSEFWEHWSKMMQDDFQQVFKENLENVFKPETYTLTGVWQFAQRMQDDLQKKMRGFGNFLQDYQQWQAGEVKKPEGFEFGKDVAATPKTTVYESANGLLKIHRYGNGTGKPILFCYSYINAYYILDLMPKYSVVEYFVNEGFDVFITDWPPPNMVTRSAIFEDYLVEMLHGMNKIRELTGCKKIGALSYCIGGVLLNILAALHPERFKYLINLTTGMDTQVGEQGMGAFSAFCDTDLNDLEDFLHENGGVFPGHIMTMFFESVKPKNQAAARFESYWNGVQPGKPDPVTFWNLESSRDVPGPAHLWFLMEVYNKNSLAKGKMKVLSKIVNLKNITHPYCNVFTRFDHIVPLSSALRNSALVGTPAEHQQNIMIQGGHVRGIINPPMFPLLTDFAKKYA